MKKRDKTGLERLAQEASNDIYSTSVKYFEGAEHQKLIIGNGHHMAQKLAEMAKQMLLSRSVDAKGSGIDPLAINCLPRVPDDIQEVRARCGCRFINGCGKRLAHEKCVLHGGRWTWVVNPLADTKGVCEDCLKNLHMMCARRKKKCACKKEYHIVWWLRWERKNKKK